MRAGRSQNGHPYKICSDSRSKICALLINQGSIFRVKYASAQAVLHQGTDVGFGPYNIQYTKTKAKNNTNTSTNTNTNTVVATATATAHIDREIYSLLIRGQFSLNIQYTIYTIKNKCK